MRLGWSHGDQEVFSREEMIAAFDIKDVNKAASAFNAEKLQWLNQQHMMRSPTRELAAALRASLARLGVLTDDQALLEGVVNAQRERAKTLKEMAQHSQFFFREFDQYDAKAARKHLTGATLPSLEAVSAGLESLAEWNAGAIHTVLDAVATRNGAGLGSVAQPLRVAVCGTAVSPPIDLTVALIGRERTLARMQRAIAIAASTPS